MGGEGPPPAQQNVSLRGAGVDLPECQERRRQAHKHEKVSVFLKASPAFGRRRFHQKKKACVLLRIQSLWSPTRASRSYHQKSLVKSQRYWYIPPNFRCKPGSTETCGQSREILYIEILQNLTCLRQVRLSVLHILDGLFVCRRLLTAYRGRIGYFLSKSEQLVGEFRHIHCQILHRSLEPVQCYTNHCVMRSVSSQ